MSKIEKNKTDFFIFSLPGNLVRRPGLLSTLLYDLIITNPQFNSNKKNFEFAATWYFTCDI